MPFSVIYKMRIFFLILLLLKLQILPRYSLLLKTHFDKHNAFFVFQNVVGWIESDLIVSGMF